MEKVAIITLGCPKNTVESEYLLGILHSKDFLITTDLNEAEIVIIHTCSFIDDAKIESEECIESVLSIKKKRDIKVFVTGCLPQLLKENIKQKFPDIDRYIGTGSLKKIPDIIAGKKCKDLFIPGGLNDSKHRILSSVLPTAYLKISEGCNHRCSFCIIPDLRGKHKSRTIASLVDEVKVLAEAGIQEIIIIAQDTTSYGIDLYNRHSLDKLLSSIAKIKGIKWIRLMYAYPSSITGSLIDTIKEYDNICKYMDIPIQHINKNILAAMKRPLNTQGIIENIKSKIPDIVLRTSLITGFPGETDKDFKELLSFINSGYFLYAGVFVYSDQKEAASSKLKGHIPFEKADERRVLLEKAQYEVYRNKVKEMKGKEIEVFIENFKKISEGKYLIEGRSSFQAPEIDGKVIAETKKPLQLGSFYKAIIKNNKAYNINIEIKL